MNKAGIYIINDTITDDSYVGASCDLEARINAHLGSIRNNDGRWPGRRFSGSNIENIECRILELVEVPPGTRIAKRPADHCEAVLYLLAREQHWIEKLRPTLNVKGNRRLKLSEIPVGSK